MTPLKYYLARAVYDWAVDNGLTPYVIVASDAAGVRVPNGYAENGRIVLNLHPQALQGFAFDPESIQFSARFGGRSFPVEIPLAAVLAVYAKENGQGVSFPERDEPPPEPSALPSGSGGATRKGPALRRIK